MLLHYWSKGRRLSRLVMHLAKNYGNRAFRVHELPPLVFRACCPCKGSGYGSCGRRAFAPDAPTPVALGGEPRQVQRAGSNTNRRARVHKKTAVDPLLKVPPASRGNRIRARFPPLREGNLQEGGNCKLRPRDWDYFTSTLTGIAFPAPPR